MKAAAKKIGGFMEIIFSFSGVMEMVVDGGGWWWRWWRCLMYEIARGMSIKGKPAVSRKAESQTRWPPWMK